VEIYFNTLPLPPTFLGTFMMTLTLDMAITKRVGALKRIVAIYVAFGILSFIIEIALDIGRVDASSAVGQIKDISAVYYLVAALSIVVFYIWVFWRAHKFLGEISGGSDNRSNTSFLPKLHQMLIRNLWIISSLYLAWIGLAVSITVLELAHSTTPTEKASLYFFYYLDLALISLFHVLILRPSKAPSAPTESPSEELSAHIVTLPSLEETSEPLSQ
jgi:hypothetical protein